MNTNTLTTVAALSDADLLSRLSLLATREREASVDLIAHLAELEAREIYLAEGYGSLFAYCTVGLRLSEHAAYNRIEAARVARKFPMVLDLLAAGAVNLTTLRLLGPHLTPDNHQSVLAEATGRGKRGVAELAARISPRPDIPSSIRKLPATPARSGLQPAAPGLQAAVRTLQRAGPSWPEPEPAMPMADSGSTVRPATPASGAWAPSSEPGAHRPVIAPLSPERYRVQFTVGKETHEKLRLVQDLLRREIPDGDPGAIFDRALTLLLEQVGKRKLASATTPRPGRGFAAGSRRIPAEVKRTVWRRDGGRCGFVAKSGRRCAERAFLEFHHVEPFAIGGEATAENISLRCRRHNVHEAELVFGPWVPRTRSGTSRSTPHPGHEHAPDGHEHV